LVVIKVHDRISPSSPFCQRSTTSPVGFRTASTSGLGQIMSG
jgi:hypothetical protein